MTYTLLTVKHRLLPRHKLFNHLAHRTNPLTPRAPARRATLDGGEYTWNFQGSMDQPGISRQPTITEKSDEIAAAALSHPDTHLLIL